MIFNPLFFNNAAGAETTSLAKTKLSGSNYLFSDIINVYMSEDKTAGAGAIKNIKIPLMSGNIGKIDIKQILASNKIDLKKIIEELTTGTKNDELKSLLKGDETEAEIKLNEEELGALVEGIVNKLPIALLTNLNSGGIAKAEVKELLAQEIKSEISKNNSIALNTTEGKIKLEITGLNPEQKKEKNTAAKTSAENAVPENRKFAQKLKVEMPELASAKQKPSAGIPLSGLNIIEEKEAALNAKIPKDIKLKLSKIEENPVTKNKNVESSLSSEILKNGISSDQKASVSRSPKSIGETNETVMNKSNGEIKTAENMTNAGVGKVKAETIFPESKLNAADKQNLTETPVMKKENISNENTAVKTETAFNEKITSANQKTGAKQTTDFVNHEKPVFKKEEAPNDKTVQELNKNEEKNSTVEKKNTTAKTESGEKIIFEDKKSEVKQTANILNSEKQGIKKEEILNDKMAADPKVNEDKKKPDENVKTVSNEKTAVEGTGTSNETPGKKGESESSENKNNFGEMMNQADKKVSEKSDFQIPQTEQKTRSVKAPEIIKEISRFIERNDKSSITLNIEPEQLGKVKIMLETHENLVSAKIEVENEAIKHVVENKLNELYSNLSQNGIQLSSVNVSLTQAENKNFKPYTGKKKGSGKEDDGNGVSEKEEGKSVKKYGYNTYEFLV